jgi:hypothetical protein
LGASAENKKSGEGIGLLTKFAKKEELHTISVCDNKPIEAVPKRSVPEL